MFHKEIDTATPIHSLLAKRWSGVAYDASRPVSLEDLRALAEAARWAPSCFGDQPWRFIICSKSEDSAAWQKAFDCLAEGNQPWCRQAPVLVIACTDTLFSRNDRPNSFGPYDTGAASISMCLQAAELGLMTHQMAGFSPEQVSKSFDVPERYQPLAMMTVGYQMPETAIPEGLQTRETAARKRNALGSQFFLGAWDQGI